MADAAEATAAPAEMGVSGNENLSLETVYDIPVQITVVLGRTSMQVNQLLKLGRGAVIELEKKVGEPIDIFVNNRWRRWARSGRPAQWFWPWRRRQKSPIAFLR